MVSFIVTTVSVLRPTLRLGPMHSTLTSLKVYNSSEKFVFCPSIVIVGMLASVWNALFGQ